MNLWTWLYRRVCPSCRPSEPVDRHPAIRSIEQTGEGLDQFRRELRRMTEQMRDGPTPLLGERPNASHRRKEPS